MLSSYIQKKNKREAERRQGLPGAPIPRSGQATPPLTTWPKTAGDWHEHLRRILEGNVEHSLPAPPPIQKSPPPIVRPVPRVVKKTITKYAPELSEGDAVFVSPLTQSGTTYDRASHLAERVSARMERIDQQTKTHKPRAEGRFQGRSGSANIIRLTQNRALLRDAFITSLIFSPPAGLRPANQDDSFSRL